LHARTRHQWPLLCTLSTTLLAASSFAARPALRVQIEPSAPKLPVGVKQGFYVRLDYADGSVAYDYSPQSWRIVSATCGVTVASIDEKGWAQTLAAGHARLEVNYEGHHAATTLTVFDEPPTALELSPPYETVDRGTEFALQVKAQFASSPQSWRWWERDGLVSWTATDVEAGTHVVSIDEHGRARALNSGVAEIAATVAGKRVSTQVMVVEPAADSPRRIVGRKLSPPAVYRACRARLRRLWLPKLRALAGAPVELRGKSTRRRADISFGVRGADAPTIDIYWDPDECDAGGPTTGWSGNFDWRVPRTPLEKLLTFAGYDCLAYPSE
jgi:hypothetical protein